MRGRLNDWLFKDKDKEKKDKDKSHTKDKKSPVLKKGQSNSNLQNQLTLSPSKTNISTILHKEQSNIETVSEDDLFPHKHITQQNSIPEIPKLSFVSFKEIDSDTYQHVTKSSKSNEIDPIPSIIPPIDISKLSLQSSKLSSPSLPSLPFLEGDSSGNFNSSSNSSNSGTPITLRSYQNSPSTSVRKSRSNPTTPKSGGRKSNPGTPKGIRKTGSHIKNMYSTLINSNNNNNNNNNTNYNDKNNNSINTNNINNNNFTSRTNSFQVLKDSISDLFKTHKDDKFSSLLLNCEIDTTIIDSDTRQKCIEYVRKNLKNNNYKINFKKSHENTIFGRYLEYQENSEGKKYPLVVTFGKDYSIYLITNIVLGEGASGKVCLGYDLTTAEKVAVKIAWADGTNVDDLYNESNNLVIADQQQKALCFTIYNVNQNNESYLDLKENLELIDIKNGSLLRSAIIIIMEYLEGKTLTRILYEIDTQKESYDPAYFKAKKILSPFFKINAVIQTLEILNICHNKWKLVHGDLKTDNLLLNQQVNEVSCIDKFTISLCDFGESKTIDEIEKYFCDPKKTTAACCSTDGYKAPEINFPNENGLKPIYVKQSDYFSIGVILYEIITDVNYKGELLKKDDKNKFLYPIISTDVIRHIFNQTNLSIQTDSLENFIYTAVILPKIIELITSLMQEDYKLRFSSGPSLTQWIENFHQWNKCLENIKINMHAYLNATTRTSLAKNSFIVSDRIADLKKKILEDAAILKIDEGLIKNIEVNDVNLTGLREFFEILSQLANSYCRKPF